MKDIVIIGAGGFGREIKTLIDDINLQKPTYYLKGFFDDNEDLPPLINGLPLLGKIKDILYLENTSLAIGIGIPEVKQKIIQDLSGKEFDFPLLIHPSAIIGKDNVELGKGTIICGGSILTCNISLGEFVTLNLMVTVGHDSVIKDFSSCMPGVNISGEVILNESVYMGTGAKVINQVEIGESTTVGAGAVVSKNLPSRCTAVGIPAKPIKFF